MVGWSMSAKQNDEHTHKCDDWTEEYLVWKQEIVRQPEVIYISYMFILAWPSERKDCNYVIIRAALTKKKIPKKFLSLKNILFSPNELGSRKVIF